MLNSPELLGFVSLSLFLVDAGHSNVIFDVKISFVDDYRNVTFSSQLFEELYECFCDSRRTCIAKYDISDDVREVVDVAHQGSSSSGSSSSSVDYYCRYESSKTVTCGKLSSFTNTNGNYYTFHVDGIECMHSCVRVYIDKSIDFSNSELNIQLCNNNCRCPAATTSTTTETTTAATTTTTTTTTTTIKTTTPASSSVTESFSRSATETSNAENNDSDDDPPLSLIIGLTVTVIFIATIIAIVSCFLWRRKRRQNSSKPQNGTQNSSAFNEITTVRSSSENQYTNPQSRFPYSVASSSSDYNNLNANYSNVSTDNAYEYALNENAVNKAISSSTMPENYKNKDQKKSANSVLEKVQTLSQQNIDKTQEGNVKKRSNLKLSPTTERAGIHTSYSQDGEYGYSTVKGQSTGLGDYETTSVSHYNYAFEVDSQKKDSGYEYVGPEHRYDTVTTNKAGLLNNNEGSTYSMARNTETSIAESSFDQPKNIYSRLHEESKQAQNPYDTFSQPEEDAHDSQTATGSLAHQSKNIYSRLHEESRQIQNPYNTLSQPQEDVNSSRTATNYNPLLVNTKTY